MEAIEKIESGEMSREEITNDTPPPPNEPVPEPVPNEPAPEPVPEGGE